MSTTATRMTAEEFAVWSGGDRWTELIGGEVVTNQPKPIHGALQSELVFHLMSWIRSGARRGLAITPTAVFLDEYNVYAPDVLWFSHEHIPADLHEYPERVPDLCVEVRSPGTWRYDVGTKKSVYEQSCLPELWLVDDLAEVLLVFRRSEPNAAAFDVALELARGDTLSSPLLPGFELALEQLFRR